MQSFRHRVVQFAVLWALFTFLVLTYLIPAYPSTVLGWAWLLGLSVPYCAVVGVAGNAAQRAWPITGIGRFATLGVAASVIVLSTWGYFRVATIL